MNVLNKVFFIILLVILYFLVKNLSIYNTLHNLDTDDKFSLLKSPKGLEDKKQYYRTFTEYSDYLKKADVIVLGNSRPLLGISHRKIKKLNVTDNIKLYNLSFGFSDNVNFGKYLIDDKAAFPNYVLVHVGPYIFSDLFSTQAFDILSKGKWTNYLDYIDFILASRLQFCLKASFGASLLETNNHYYYRSVKTGCVESFGDINVRNFTYKAMNTVFSPELLKCVTNFVKWAEKRSIQPILFQVPAPNLDATHVSALAEKFKLPHIIPLLGIYSTYDNSHLTPESAEKFTEYFTAELINLIENM